MKLYRWKCQKCGLDWTRKIKDEPKICPICKDKGCKTFEGQENLESIPYSQKATRKE